MDYLWGVEGGSHRNRRRMVLFPVPLVPEPWGLSNVYGLRYCAIGRVWAGLLVASQAWSHRRAPSRIAGLLHYKHGMVKMTH